MARGPFAPEQPGEEDFLRQLIRARVQANPQVIREMRQLVGGNPEGAPPPTPQKLTGLIRSEEPIPAPPSPPTPSLTPRAPAGPAAGISMSGPMKGGRVSSAGSSANAAAFDRGMQRAGLGPAQRAAGLGSAQQESSFNPNAWNKGERAGGMIQWRANRLSALQQFASQKGEKGFGSPETQGEFFGLEAQGKTRALGSDESRGSRAFLAARTPEQASQALKSNIRWGHTGGRHEYSRAWGAKLPADSSPPPAPSPTGTAAPGPRAEAPAPPSDGRVRVASTDPNFVPTPPVRPADTVPAAPAVPVPPSRAEAFRTEQIGGLPATAPLPPSRAEAGLPGVTVAETPATATTPATVTKVDPATGGLRTYVVTGKNPGIVDKINPEFSTRLQKMIEEAPPEVRDQLRIRSAYRSPEEQQVLYTRYQAAKARGESPAPVAAPGRSRHQHGNAIDLAYGNQAAREYAQANAAKYQLHFPVAGEDWHIEPVEARKPEMLTGADERNAPATATQGPGTGKTPEMLTPLAPGSPPDERLVPTPDTPADTAGSGLGGLLSGLAKGLGGGSGGGNLNVETHISPGMGQGYDEKLGAMSKAALGAQPLFGNIGDLAKTKAMQKMFDLQGLADIGQPQMARRKLAFGLGG